MPWRSLLLPLLFAVTLNAHAQQPPPDEPSPNPTSPNPTPTPVTPDTNRAAPTTPGLAPPLNPPLLEDASDALTTALFQLTAPSLFDSDRDVDRKIGSPWELQASTNARLDSLPPRLRLLVYSTLAERLGDLVFLQNDNNRMPFVPFGGDRVRVTFVGGTGEVLMTNVANTVRSHFNPDELADLGVYAMSQFPLFPRSEAAWDRWKHAIVRYDVWLATAMLLLLVGTDSAAFQASKWLFTVGKEWRFGAFGYVSNLGVNGRPTVRFTARGMAPFMEMSADFVEHVQARANKPRRLLQFYAREHWLNFFSRRLGWELVASANGTYNWLHNDPREQNRFFANGDLYWRRSGLLGEQFLSLLGSVNVNTDFSRAVGGGTTVSVEDTGRDFAAALRVSTVVSRVTHAQEWRVGLVIGGAIVSRVAIARAALATSANRVRADLESLQRVETQFRTLEARFDDEAHHHEFDEDPELMRRMRVMAVARAQAREELTRSIKDYEEARRQCYRLEGRGNADDTVGPLPAYEMLRARSALDESI